MDSVFFIALYPGLDPRSITNEYERKDMPAIFITRDGEFVSINGRRYGGEMSSAVFYDVQDLRDLRDALDEAIDIFQKAKSARRAKEPQS